MSEDGFPGVLATHLETSRLTPEAERLRCDRVLAMGRLAGGVAHDFANLLTLISGYSELILGRMSEGDPLRPELEEIRSAAGRGSRLIAQLLGYTRAQAAEPKVQDLNALVAGMERMLRPIIGENVELVEAPDPNLGKVLADSGQLEQVIMNLVLNARDAMPRGGRITIATANAEFDEEEARAHSIRAGAYVVIAVSDTGAGMDAESMSHLFQPFFTTKPRGMGTGLGLSTVYSIVRQNGGDIWARSEPGVGSTFTVCLPRTGMQAADAASETPPRRSSNTRHETILLVEDEDGVRRLLKHLLSRQGYTVLEGRDGRSALEALRAHSGRVHLLLTDMVMPGMSGRETAAEVLKLSPETRVIYMSGYTGDELTRSGALGPGMSFLQKPLKPETLGARIREVLDTGGANAG
ncbi:MAG: ATP-binding protein [Bryobacteraceae bacterium]